MACAEKQKKNKSVFVYVVDEMIIILISMVIQVFVLVDYKHNGYISLIVMFQKRVNVLLPGTKSILFAIITQTETGQVH